MVFWTACSALWTVSLSLLTFARAEAMFASRVAALSVGLEVVVEELEDEPASAVVSGCFASRFLGVVVSRGEAVVGEVVVEAGALAT